MHGCAPRFRFHLDRQLLPRLVSRAIWQTELAAVSTAWRRLRKATWRVAEAAGRGCNDWSIGLKTELRHEDGDKFAALPCVRGLRLLSCAAGQLTKQWAHCTESVWLKEWCALQQWSWGLMHQPNTRPLAREWHPSKTLWDGHVEATVTRRLQCWPLQVDPERQDATNTMRRTLLDKTPLNKPTRRSPLHGRKLKSWCARGHDVSISFLV